MPSWFVKSLQCKSRAFDDVFHPSPKSLTPSYSCRGTSNGVNDVIKTRRGRNYPRPDPNFRRPASKPDQDPEITIRTRRSVSARTAETEMPVLAELPDGHPSRNVVEIIFESSWSPAGEFPGRVEMILKVENGSSAVTRFEEYRAAVMKACAANYCHMGERDEHARCVADGNEMMRFYPLIGPTPGSCGGVAWGFPAGKGAAVCTYSGSGEAHASGGGGCGGGRRAVLVCRVVAGRVSKKNGFGLDPDDRFGFDSLMSRDGELVVFDTRAVLPCFLVIYRL